MAVEKKTSAEMAFKKINVLSQAVMAFVNDSEKAKLIDDKVVIYKNLISLVGSAVNLFLRQNMNTFTNRLYFDVLRGGVRTTKEQYKIAKQTIVANMQGENKYRYQVNKMNALLSDVEALTQNKKITADSKSILAQKLEELKKNAVLRPRHEEVIDILPMLAKGREDALRAKHVNAIYSKIIKPILDSLLSQGAIDEENAKQVQKILSMIAMHGHLEDKKNPLKATLTISYGPKEEALNDAKVFGYRGNVGLMYKEEISLGNKAKQETVFDSSADYVDHFRKALLKEKGGKKVFYHTFITKVFEDHKYLKETLTKLFDKMSKNLEKQGASKNVVKEFKKEVEAAKRIIFGSNYCLVIKAFDEADTKKKYLQVHISKLTPEEKAKVEAENKAKAPAPKKKEAPKPSNKTKLPKELEEL